MKHIPICLPRRQTFAVLTAAACMGLLAGFSSVKADDGPGFISDFAKGSFDTLGWKADGNWIIKDLGNGNPAITNDPGPVADFGPDNKKNGTLTKTFDTIHNPTAITLTYTAGLGWGEKNHVQSIEVMLLDPDGTGYIFHTSRAKATWGAQWGFVTKYVPQAKQLNWAPSEIDTTQVAVHDNGGLRTYTITRDANGNWSFNGDGWVGGPLQFGDSTTTAFSQVVLVGAQNTDEEVFGKIKLETTK